MFLLQQSENIWVIFSSSKHERRNWGEASFLNAPIFSVSQTDTQDLFWRMRKTLQMFMMRGLLVDIFYMSSEHIVTFLGANNCPSRMVDGALHIVEPWEGGSPELWDLALECKARHKNFLAVKWSGSEHLVLQCFAVFCCVFVPKTSGWWFGTSFIFFHRDILLLIFFRHGFP